MRSVIPQFAKVEGHESLVRDMSSHAIVSTNDDEFSAYQRRRLAEKKQKQIVEQQSQEIASLKSDIEEIKQMLSQVLRGK
jgi:hypothetical protein